MTEPLTPNRALFDFEFRLNHRPKPPAVDGNLTGWTDRDRLPDLTALEGKRPFAPVWACWNEQGIYIACRVAQKKRPLQCNSRTFWKGDNLRLCTDMRDARANRRASRYCQQFYLLPTGGSPNKNQPVAGSTKIHFAREDAPRFTSAPTKCQGPGRWVPAETDPHIPHEDADARIRIAAAVSRNGYILEAHIPASCLVGFQPADHPRIGFFYILEDADFGQQYLTVGDELNWHIDPSTWPTAVLAPSD